MSIRFRLTLLYTTILALALIVSGIALYATQSQLTLDIVKTNLVRQAESFQHGPQRPPRGGNYEQSEGTIPGRWTQLRSMDGDVVGQTLDLSDTTLPLSQTALVTVQGGGNVFETATVDDEPLLIYSFQTQGPNASNIVQIAYPIAEREESLNTLRLILIIGSSLVIVAAFIISWIVGGTALAPIQRITHTAQAIGSEHDFSRRVAHDGPNDEVGQLATTFNTMLSELETAYRQLQESLESQRRFVADASHELRTPLTTLRGNIELLRNQPRMMQEERAEVLGDTQDEVERLIRLVNQLLALARADAGQALRHDPVPLDPLLDDICRQAKTLAPERNLICQPTAGLVALGDRDALKQVLVILLDNAIVHTAPQAAITITSATQNGRVRIDVQDTGAGIPPDVLPHLFERFYRGDNARSGRSTGLGLAIAQELVQAQDGTLTATSQVGVGTTFTINLPQARSHLA